MKIVQVNGLLDIDRMRISRNGLRTGDHGGYHQYEFGCYVREDEE